MEVITIEDKVFKEILMMFGKVCNTALELAQENKALKSKKLLSAKEVAAMTPYSEKTIRMKKDEIGYKSEGGMLMFKPEFVQAWIDRGYIAPKTIKYIAR